MAATALAACANSAGTAGVQPPTLDQVKNWLQVASEEIPGFVQDLIVSGQIKAGDVPTVKDWVARFQVTVTAILQLPVGTDPRALLNDALNIAQTLMTFFPQSAPFIPLVAGLQLLINGFLNSQPVQQAVPPKPATLAQMHARTRSMR
jgi:hypothetical protein